MLIIGILIGIITMCFFFIIVFMLLPTREITKSSNEHWENLEIYWKKNTENTERIADAIEEFTKQSKT